MKKNPFVAIVALSAVLGVSAGAAFVDDQDTKALWHIDQSPVSIDGRMVTLDDSSSGRTASHGMLDYDGSASQPTYWGGDSAPGHSGYLQFSGDDDIYASSAWDGQDSVRVDLLIDFQAMPANGERVGIIQSVPWRLYAKNTAGQVRLELHVLNAAEDGYTIVYSQVSLGVYTWYDFRFEIADGTAVVSVDGAKYSSVLVGGMSGSASPVVVGRNLDGDEYFKGLVDEIRVATGPITPPPAAKPKPRLDMATGKPILYINNQPQIPFLFKGNYQLNNDPVKLGYTVSQNKRSYGFGQRMYAFNSTTSWWQDYAQIDSDNMARIEVAPEGHFLLSVGVTPSYGWANGHMDEIYKEENNDPMVPHPTVASAVWQTDAANKVYEWTQHLETTDYADHVYGMILTTHSSAEWFLMNAWSSGEFYDFSPSNLAGFRSWLRTKYGNDVSALRAAWNSPSVTFDTVVIPSSSARFAGNSFSLWDPQGGGTRMMIPDYYDYMADSNAGSVINISNTVKSLTDSRYLLSASFGYMFELDWVLNRGAHGRFSKVIKNSGVDLYWGPYAYGDRHIGGSSSMHGPFDSLAINGKLYIAEDDTLAHVTDIGYTDGSDAQHTEVSRRDYFNAFIHNFGLWRLDLGSANIFDEDQYWHESKNWLKISKAKLFDQGTYTPEIMAFMEEDSVPYIVDAPLMTPMLASPLHANIRKSLERAGTSVGYYLTQDMEDHNPQLPTTAKLLVFMNQIKTDAAQIAALRSWLDGKDVTVVWVYAPGLITDQFDEAAMEQLTGITLKVSNEQRNLKTRIINITHPLTAGHKNEIFGTDAEYGPLVYVDDSSAETLGNYVGAPWKISFAEKQVGTWKSVFIGTPDITEEVWERLADYAGCAKFTDQRDIVAANGSLLMIHTKDFSGNRVIDFPDTGDSSYEVYDVFNDQVVAVRPGPATLNLQGLHTYLYVLGSRDQQMGIFPATPTADNDLEIHVLHGIYASHIYGCKWFKNGAPQPALDDELLVPAAQTASGEQWICKVYIDGDYLGEETVGIRSSGDSDLIIRAR